MEQGEFLLQRPVKRVLVVDDDADINRLLRARLSARGYDVTGAANGEEALAQVADAPPDLVFLDVSMPGLSGLDVLERIRAHKLDLSVIMTTAFGSEQVAIDALRRGADDYLRKPFESSEFQSVLRRTVERLELSRQNTVLRRELDEKRRQLESELVHAGKVQAEMLPRTAPSLPGFELAARFVPAREVGGDFYDWYMPVPELLTLTLCDVMGKGMPAALMMATARAVIRAVARASPPEEALRFITKVLDPDLARAEQFITLFLAQLDVAAARMLFVDAGHGHVCVRRADGTIEALQPRGLPLGVLPDEQYAQGAVSFGPSDALILYSDGLLDVSPDVMLNHQTLAQRLRSVTSAEETIARLVNEAAISTPPPDDLTIVVLWCQGRS